MGGVARWGQGGGDSWLARDFGIGMAFGTEVSAGRVGEIGGKQIDACLFEHLVKRG